MKNNFKTFFELHLFEIKCNLFILLFSFFYLFIISYNYNDQIIYLFVKKLIETNMLKYFIFTNITEIFLTKISISFYITFFILIQFILIQFCFFIAPGLYKHENYLIIKIYILYLLFNIFILKIILFNIIPKIWYFFFNINFTNNYLFNIYFEPKFNNYFIFITKSFSYIYLILFYFFIFSIFIYNQIFDIYSLIKLRKFFYLKFILISILISPPDFISQFILSFIFIIFFELYIYIYLFLLRYFFNKI